MNRIWSYVEGIVVASYYAASFVTPTNLRNTAQAISRSSSKVGEHLRGRRTLLPLTVFFLALSLPEAALAQNVSPAPLAGAALTPEVIALRRAGNAALYNIDYATAREKFEEIKKLQPQHPAGDIYIATVIWLEH